MSWRIWISQDTLVNQKIDKRIPTGRPSSKYEHRRASALLRNIQNIRICMGEKTCRFCNQWKWKDFNKKNSLPYLKCLLHLSFVVYGPIYDRFTSVYVFFCKRFKPLYIEKTVYIKTHKTEWMLRNNADAHISSLGYLWYPLQYPNLVESKLNCKSKSWLQTPSHITKSTQLFGTMKNSPTELSIFLKAQRRQVPLNSHNQ